MKALIVTLMFPVLLKSCDEGSTQVGAPPPVPPPSRTSSEPRVDSNGNPLDAPLDGGLSVLLVAGTAYGVRKYYNKKKDA